MRVKKPSNFDTRGPLCPLSTAQRSSQSPNRIEDELCIVMSENPRAELTAHPAVPAPTPAGYFLMLDDDANWLESSRWEFAARGIGPASVGCFQDASQALRGLHHRRYHEPLIALLSWPLAGPKGARLLRVLRGRQALVIALLAPDWRDLPEPDSVDGSLLKPGSSSVLVLHALALHAGRALGAAGLARFADGCASAFPK